MAGVGNLDLIRDLNTNKLLNTLKRSQPISRVELARVTGLSFPTVSRIVNRLSRRELIVEHSEGRSSGGRRPTLLRLNPDASYVVGIEIDSTETVVALLNLNGEIKGSKTYATRPELGPGVLLDNLGHYIEQMISERCPDRSKIMGIGIAVTGNVTPENGVLVYSAKLGWKNVPFKEAIYKRTGIVTEIKADTQAMALGEHLFGNARDVDHLAWVFVSTGVGVGLIDKGAIYRGAHGTAGELGHVSVLKNGPLCSCGRKGCLETMVGTAAVLPRLIKTVARGKGTLISDLVRGRFEDLRISHVFHAAKEGDALARAVVEEMAYYLGVGLSMIANLLDPGLIVTGGPVIESGGDDFFEMVRECTAEDILPERSANLVIKRSALGEQVGVIGAASVVYQEKLRLPMASP